MAFPNIVYIICHDLGRCLSCYGRRPLDTPNLDRLAAEGVRFTHHFSTAPSCSPSRGSLMTGKYPHSNGLMGLVGKNGWELPRSQKTLPQFLRQAGYTTYLCGLQHERQHTREDVLSLGYDHWISSRGGFLAETVAQGCVELLAKKVRQPFFISVATAEAHRPFRSDSLASPDDVYLPPYLPDDPVVRKEMAGFAQKVKQLDVAVGTILDALDSQALSDDTVVIFTTDHGIDMPRAKGTLYDPGIETVMIARWRGTIESGRVSDALVSNVDLLPTLLDMLGVEYPSPVQGRSYWPVLAGGDFEPRDAIFAEKTHHCHYDPMRCIRTKRHKFIHNFGPLRQIEIPADCEMDTLSSVPELYIQRRPLTELYDLISDPMETTNLSVNPEYAAVEEDLKNRLKQWMEATDDPLLRGTLPIPRFI